MYIPETQLCYNCMYHSGFFIHTWTVFIPSVGYRRVTRAHAHNTRLSIYLTTCIPQVGSRRLVAVLGWVWERDTDTPT